VVLGSPPKGEMIKTAASHSPGVGGGGHQAILGRRPRVLVIDDDPTVLDVIQRALRTAGIDCVTAASGAQGLELASDPAIDLLLIDLRLGETDGIAVIEHLHRQGDHIPFAIVTGFGTVPSTIQAIKLGALDVIEKPFSLDELIAKTQQLLISAESVRPARGVTHETIGTTVSSAAEAWASLVLIGMDANHDLPTLTLWAREVCRSYTSLREACALIDVKPHDARDFTRLLRAVMHAEAEDQPLEAFLDVHDMRTMKALVTRSGFGDRARGAALSVEAFIRQQRLIPASNAGLKALIRRLRQRKLIT